MSDCKFTFSYCYETIFEDLSKERRLRGEGQRSYSKFKVRRGGREEIPLIQGKEQKLYFAGGAMKRYPMSKVREAQVKW